MAVGISPKDLAACVESDRQTRAVTDGQDAGNLLGVESTPTPFINGRLVTGAQPFEVFARVIDDELARSGPGGTRYQGGSVLCSNSFRYASGDARRSAPLPS